MRVAKTEQLKKDIQIYQQNHEREVDAKDSYLQMLDRDLEEAEAQRSIDQALGTRDHIGELCVDRGAGLDLVEIGAQLIGRDDAHAGARTGGGGAF